MGAVTAISEQQCFDNSGATILDRLDLLYCAVFSVLALNHENWLLDVWQKLFDVPGAKVGIEPNVIPATERAFDIGAMIPPQTTLERSILVGIFCFDDAFDAELL